MRLAYSQLVRIVEEHRAVVRFVPPLRGSLGQA